MVVITRTSSLDDEEDLVRRPLLALVIRRAVVHNDFLAESLSMIVVRCSRSTRRAIAQRCLEFAQSSTVGMAFVAVVSTGWTQQCQTSSGAPFRLHYTEVTLLTFDRGGNMSSDVAARRDLACSRPLR